jgi:hypothetical protein
VIGSIAVSGCEQRSGSTFRWWRTLPYSIETHFLPAWNRLVWLICSALRCVVSSAKGECRRTRRWPFLLSGVTQEYDGTLRCRPQAAFTYARVAGCRSSFAAVAIAARSTAMATGRLPLARAAFGRPGADTSAGRNGRLAQAEPIRRYRTRLNKVTDQSSAAAAADALLLANPTTSTKATTPDTDRRLPARCHFCHRACSALVRLGPLRTRVFHHVRTATDLTGNDP